MPDARMAVGAIDTPRLSAIGPDWGTSGRRSKIASLANSAPRESETRLRHSVCQPRTCPDTTDPPRTYSQGQPDDAVPDRPNRKAARQPAPVNDHVTVPGPLRP